MNVQLDRPLWHLVLRLNPVAKKDNHRKLVAWLPRNRILTETDGPFTQAGSRPARPLDVASTIESLGILLSTERDEMAATIKSNLRELIS